MTDDTGAVAEMDVDRGNLIPKQYTGNLRTFLMVDALLEPFAEGVQFSDGRVVLVRGNGQIMERYDHMERLVYEWFGRGAILWAAPTPNRPYPPRRFVFRRNADTTGFSGTGIAVEGAQFSHGGVVLMWLGELRSLVEWASIQEAITVNGHGGDTVVEWLDPE